MWLKVAGIMYMDTAIDERPNTFLGIRALP